MLRFGSRAANKAARAVSGANGWDKFQDQLVGGWGLDSDALYWVRMDFTTDGSTPWTAWRGLRNGGGDQNLAGLPLGKDETLIDTVVVPVADRLIIHSVFPVESNAIFSVPKGGGDATRLPIWPGGKVLGVSSDGTVLWQRHTGEASAQKRSDHFEAGRLLPGGVAVETFWPEKPPSAYPRTAWDDGRGGFYVEVWEWATDDAVHATIWALDANGVGQRLACDPVVGTTLSAAAVAPDGIYAIVRYPNFYWEVVKIARSSVPATVSDGGDGTEN